MIKVKAPEGTLNVEAERIGYKLRLNPDLDKGGFSEECPAYAAYNTKNNKLFERFPGGNLYR